MDGCRYLSHKRDVIKINVTRKLCSGSLDELVSLINFFSIIFRERDVFKIDRKDKIANNDVLQYALENGMIDLAYVREQIEMNKRKEVLEKHGKCIWYSESEQTWYCHIPDPSKKSGRKKVKRKNKSDIEDVVYNYYSGLNLKKSKKTFAELFFEYMEHKKTQVKSGTIQRMIVDWKKFYEPCKEFVDKPFTEITKINVDDFLNDIAEKYHPKDKSFRNICGILKQTFEYAVDAEYINKSPYRTSKVNKKNIVHTRKKPSEKEVFTREEQDLLTAELERRISEDEGYLIPWIILLDFEIGTRIGEILAISNSDVVDGRLHIHKQLVQEYDISDLNDVKTIGWHVVEYTKSDCGDRWIPLTDKAIRYIKHIAAINNKLNRQFEDYLFITTEGTITDHSVKAQLERSCERAGIPKRSTHKIRKTYASTLYKNGVSVTDIGKLLGHVDETTTLRHYIFSLDDTRDFDDRIRNALSLKEKKNEVEIVTKRDHNIISLSDYQKGRNKEKPLIISGFL